MLREGVRLTYEKDGSRSLSGDDDHVDGRGMCFSFGILTCRVGTDPQTRARERCAKKGGGGVGRRYVAQTTRVIFVSCGWRSRARDAYLRPACLT